MPRGPEAFRSISEASEELGVAQHVLRFWETRFSFIRPMTRAGGRRFYRRQDLEVLRGVQALLHRDGYTIKGVQRLHREQGVARVLAAGAGAAPPGGASPSVVDERQDLAWSPEAASTIRLRKVLGDLERAKADVDRLLGAPPNPDCPPGRPPPIRRLP